MGSFGLNVDDNDGILIVRDDLGGSPIVRDLGIPLFNDKVETAATRKYQEDKMKTNRR